MGGCSERRRATDARAAPGPAGRRVCATRLAALRRSARAHRLRGHRRGGRVCAASRPRGRSRAVRAGAAVDGCRPQARAARRCERPRSALPVRGRKPARALAGVPCHAERPRRRAAAAARRSGCRPTSPRAAARFWAASSRSLAAPTCHCGYSRWAQARASICAERATPADPTRTAPARSDSDRSVACLVGDLRAEEHPEAGKTRLRRVRAGGALRGYRVLLGGRRDGTPGHDRRRDRTPNAPWV